MVVAVVNGREVKAYQVAANAIMAGCSPEHLPICIAFAQALSDNAYLNSLKSGKLTPMMYVNGPVARQIGIDNTQGMTTEEANIGIARFMELALINLAGIKRTNSFGNVQPLVFSENEEACLNIGWKPHHIEEGYQLNDNVITATSFSMWGNNVTPATDLPEEIMKVLAWDITEKNLGGLGSASAADNANTKRLIFITEPVAAALATKYKTKDALENALVENARRPLWMRTYAYYYANTDDALNKSFSDVYSELQSTASEDAELTASPSWMNGITYANIETVATMTKGNTDIIITGDGSRNKTQVMPGGVSVTKEIKLSDRWNSLVTSMNYGSLESFYLAEHNRTVTPPESLPSVLTNGTYRILDPATGSTYLTRAGRVYYDSLTNTLHYYAFGASAAASVELDYDADSAFISYLTNLGYNSSFSVNNGKMSAAIIRFSSNARKLTNNTVALTGEAFDGMALTLHANNTSNSNAAGGLAKHGATVVLSDTITSFTINLDGNAVIGDSTNAGFIKLNGTTVTVNPAVEAGATAVIGAANSNGTYRTITFVNGGDGTYTATYNTENTLSITVSTIYLKGTFNNWEATDAFDKTGNNGIVTLKKELSAGTYKFKIYDSGTDSWYGNGNSVITQAANRMIIYKTGDECTLEASGGTYEFKFELATNRLSVYYANNTPEAPQSEPGYYLVGNMTDWTVNSSYKLMQNNAADTEEYMITGVALSITSQLKVVYSEDGTTATVWYPGLGDNYGANGEITADGTYTLYFRPNYNGGSDWFYNVIYTVPTDSHEQQEDEIPAYYYKDSDDIRELPAEYINGIMLARYFDIMGAYDSENNFKPNEPVYSSEFENALNSIDANEPAMTSPGGEIMTLEALVQRIWLAAENGIYIYSSGLQQSCLGGYDLDVTYSEENDLANAWTFCIKKGLITQISERADFGKNLIITRAMASYVLSNYYLWSKGYDLNKLSINIAGIVPIDEAKMQKETASFNNDGYECYVKYGYNIGRYEKSTDNNYDEILVYIDNQFVIYTVDLDDILFAEGKLLVCLSDYEQAMQQNMSSKRTSKAYDNIPTSIRFDIDDDGEFDDYTAIAITDIKPQIQAGDLNETGELDKADCLIIQKHLTGLFTLSSEKLRISDINGDTTVNLLDAYTVWLNINENFTSLKYLIPEIAYLGYFRDFFLQTSI